MLKEVDCLDHARSCSTRITRLLVLEYERTFSNDLDSSTSLKVNETTTSFINCLPVRQHRSVKNTV